MDVSALVATASRSDRCRVHPPAGRPDLPAGVVLPEDLAAFYDLCGGVDLFPDGDYGISIVGPGELLPSNVVIVGEQFDDDPSSSWHIIARTSDREYLSIDLSPDRNGRCYDSFHEIHGIVGSSPVIARNFTELFERLENSRGGHWYWLEPGFDSLGDAYK
jgi:hypothetical protein